MKQIGLVLSGGMAKGAYQIGALRAISEYFAPSDFKYVSSASIGALNAYAYLSRNLEKAAEIWESVGTDGSRIRITTMLRSSFIPSTINNLVSNCKIPNSFYVPLLNLSGRELTYYNFAKLTPGEMKQYLRASIALPLYNKGVSIGAKKLYDGAVIDNIPIYPVLRNPLDYCICIYFDDYNYIFEDDTLDDKIIKLTFPDNKIISNSIRLEHNSIKYMMDEGYRRAKEVLDYVFCDGISDRDKIYDRVKSLNSANSKKKLRITGDVLVTNMNRITKKMVHATAAID